MELVTEAPPAGSKVLDPLWRCWPQRQQLLEEVAAAEETWG